VKAKSVFEQTWARISPIFCNIPDEVEAARLRLAKAMLSVATEGITDRATLKNRAVEAMAKHCSSRVRRRA
jgi:hypothetical protein